MIRELPDSYWHALQASLPPRREPTDPVLPVDLPRVGTLSGPFDYTLSDDLLDRLRQWLYERGEKTVHYFLTEGVSGNDEPQNFAIDLWDLSHEALSEVNSGYQSLLTSPDLSWALFVDDEGRVHVAGPRDLVVCLNEAHT